MSCQTYFSKVYFIKKCSMVDPRTLTGQLPGSTPAPSFRKSLIRHLSETIILLCECYKLIVRLKICDHGVLSLGRVQFTLGPLQLSHRPLFSWVCTIYTTMNKQFQPIFHEPLKGSAMHVVLRTDNNNNKKIFLLLIDTVVRLLVWNIFYITSFISTGCNKKFCT